MSRTHGEGRASSEKGQTLLTDPEARREHRQRLLDEAEAWQAKSGPVEARQCTTTVYVDGACTLVDRAGDGSHIGPGGWAWVRLNPDNTVFASKAGSEPNTTNQRMELAAALAALRDHRGKEKLEIVSDSAYLVNCFEQSWHVKWVENDWVASSGKPVRNQDYWRAILDEVNRRHPETIAFRHVKGHIGDPGNEAADRLAVEAKLELMR